MTKKQKQNSQDRINKFLIAAVLVLGAFSLLISWALYQSEKNSSEKIDYVVQQLLLLENK